MKKFNIIISILLLVVISTSTYGGAVFSAESRKPAQARSYLELPTSVKLSAAPYVWERITDRKHLVVIGSRHERSPHSPMYDRIEAVFKRVRPELVVHESVAPEQLKTMSRDQAIKTAADLGFAVYLAGKYGAATLSGDAPIKAEFKALLSNYAAEDVFVFLTVQRLIGSVNKPNLKIARAEYANFYQHYLVQNRIPKKQEWAEWDGFLKAYEHVVGSPFSRNSWSPDFVNPTLNKGRLNQVARSSDRVRDQHLLAAISKGLKDHDRVVVVFGGWHVLALEPVLNDLLIE